MSDRIIGENDMPAILRSEGRIRVPEGAEWVGFVKPYTLDAEGIHRPASPNPLGGYVPTGKGPPKVLPKQGTLIK